MLIRGVFSNSNSSPGNSAKNGRRTALLSTALLSTLLVASYSNANPNSPADTSYKEASTIEEITVLGLRRGVEAEQKPGILSNPLRERISREVQQLHQLEEESEWRLETSRLEQTPPRMQIGYDPRNDSRAPKQAAQTTLPLDITQPATIFSVDF